MSSLIDTGVYSARQTTNKTTSQANTTSRIQSDSSFQALMNQLNDVGQAASSSTAKNGLGAVSAASQTGKSIPEISADDASDTTSADSVSDASSTSLLGLSNNSWLASLFGQSGLA